MLKVNFQDGTKVSSAKVTIDGVDYPVTPARYNGATPLSSTVMNKLQDNIDNALDNIETNLNKIEQGIYDNSLVVDAVTNTLNPTDTETYKTAELTEGQITDVIGVNDILIKGQTSQNGEPTPSSPVDVNVVSGSNVINTSSKNLFDGILENSGFQGTGLNAEGNIIRIRSKNYIRVKENQTYTINITEYNTTKGPISINISYYNKNDYSTARLSESDWKNLPYTFITPENCKFIRFLCKITSSRGESKIVYTDVNKVQLEQGSTATTYEPHQGKELPLDLGSIELCKIGDYQDYFYKSGSIWYLHKEINKITSYNGETITTSYISTTGKLSTGAKVYYVVTPTDTKITDTTLISQLEAIYSAPLYEQTNITQTNNDLPMVLDITACKDNIKGIKAFIRK